MMSQTEQQNKAEHSAVPNKDTCQKQQMATEEENFCTQKQAAVTPPPISQREWQAKPGHSAVPNKVAHPKHQHATEEETQKQVAAAPPPISHMEQRSKPAHSAAPNKDACQKQQQATEEEYVDTQKQATVTPQPTKAQEEVEVFYQMMEAECHRQWKLKEEEEAKQTDDSHKQPSVASLSTTRGGSRSAKEKQASKRLRSRDKRPEAKKRIRRCTACRNSGDAERELNATACPARWGKVACPWKAMKESQSRKRIRRCIACLKSGDAERAHNAQITCPGRWHKERCPWTKAKARKSENSNKKDSEEMESEGDDADSDNDGKDPEAEEMANHGDGDNGNDSRESEGMENQGDDADSHIRDTKMDGDHSDDGSSSGDSEEDSVLTSPMESRMW